MLLLRSLCLFVLLCIPVLADTPVTEWVKNGKVEFETGDFYVPEGYEWTRNSTDQQHVLFGVQEKPFSLIFISVHRDTWTDKHCQDAILKLLKERAETKKFSIELADPVEAPFPLAKSSESKITMLNQHISSAGTLSGSSYYGSNEHYSVVLGCLGENGPRIATDIASSFKEKLDTQETLKSSSKIIDLMEKTAKFVYLAGLLLAAGLATSVNRAKREALHNPYDACLTSIKCVVCLHVPLGILLLIRQSETSVFEFLGLFFSVFVHCLIFAAIPLYFRGSWKENHPFNAEPVDEVVDGLVEELVDEPPPEFVIPGELIDDE